MLKSHHASRLTDVVMKAHTEKSSQRTVLKCENVIDNDACWFQIFKRFYHHFNDFYFYFLANYSLFVNHILVHILR